MPVDAKTKYKAKKIKIVFFDIDDTLRVKKTGYIPESIKAVFKGLKEKGILTGIATGRGYYGVVEEILDLEPGLLQKIMVTLSCRSNSQPTFALYHGTNTHLMW